MTQEQKDLLLKDLCSRLPYKVKGLVTFNGNLFMSPIQVENRTIDGKLYDRFAVFQDSWYDNVTIKPYLFPLSSMTEEQKKEFDQLLELELKAINDEINHTQVTEFEVDFYHKHHLDWRGLIPMELAIDATNLNIY